MAADTPVMDFNPDLHAAVIEAVLRQGIERGLRLPIIAGNGAMHLVKLEHSEVLGAHFLGTVTWLNQDVVTAPLDD